ncbi:MAG: hypothetical protein GY822_14675 [Deltaproteobacteria bacterium]|nr:hypothetical protein [Deltaproteobacteria bacterium]
MLPKKNQDDRQQFLQALEMWDRPSEQLFGSCLEADVDVDSFIEQAFSSPSSGIVKV